MRLSEFFQLDTGDQIRSVLHEGVLISKKKSELSLAFLFQLDGYYVETVWNIADKSLLEIRTLPGTQSIDDHLQGIDLSKILRE